MTPEERASEAMRLHFCHSDLDALTLERIQQVMRRQIQLAQEEEREACAKTAESLVTASWRPIEEHGPNIARAIRARGKV